nr:unnamed protein product [Digitaria exilis]
MSHIGDTPSRHCRRKFPRPTAPSSRRHVGNQLISDRTSPQPRADMAGLGSYDTPEKAAQAFNAAYICSTALAAAPTGSTSQARPTAVCRTSDPDEVYAAVVSHANRAVVFSSPPSRLAHQRWKLRRRKCLRLRWH